MTEKRVSLLKKLVSAVFPCRCAFCGRIVKAGQDVCVSCGKALPYIGMGACPVCGRERKYCRCRKEKFAFERCTAPFYYEGVAKKGVLRLKFCGRREAAKVLWRPIRWWELSSFMTDGSSAKAIIVSLADLMPR